MSITERLDGLTVAVVTKEIKTLDENYKASRTTTNYRAQHRRLTVLLRVLEAEQGEKVTEDKPKE